MGNELIKSFENDVKNLINFHGHTSKLTSAVKNLLTNKKYVSRRDELEEYFNYEILGQKNENLMIA